MVPQDKVYAMRMQLAGKGIPQGDGVGFEIFDKPNFGITDFVQRANYLRALQGELARTISQIDEVEAARVMIVLPENRLLLDKDKYPTASVFVRVRGNSALQPQSINSIRFLVANSVEGLKPNHVTVVDNLGNALSENSDDDSLAGLTSSQLAARRNLEQYLAKKAQDMLEKVLGPGQAIVRVSAEINYDTLTTHRGKIRPGRPGDPHANQERREQRYRHHGEHVARRHFSEHQHGHESAQAAGSPVNNTQESQGHFHGRIRNRQDHQQHLAGGGRHQAADRRRHGRGTDGGHGRGPQSRSPARRRKSRNSAALSPAPWAWTRRAATRLTLAELPFNDQFATEMTRELDQQQKQDFWWNLARNAVYPALGLVACCGPIPRCSSRRRCRKFRLAFPWAG